jgi:hypothetical protein
MDARLFTSSSDRVSEHLGSLRFYQNAPGTLASVPL